MNLTTYSGKKESFDNSKKTKLSSLEVKLMVAEHHLYGLSHKEIAEHLCSKHGVDERTIIPNPESLSRKIHKKARKIAESKRVGSSSGKELNFIQDFQAYKKLEDKTLKDKTLKEACIEQLTDDDFNLIVNGSGATTLDKLFSSYINIGRKLIDIRNKTAVRLGTNKNDGAAVALLCIAAEEENYMEKENEKSFPKTLREAIDSIDEHQYVPVDVKLIYLLGLEWFLQPEKKKLNIFLSKDSQDVLSNGFVKGFNPAEHIGNGMYIEFHANLHPTIPELVCLTATPECGTVRVTALYRTAKALSLVLTWYVGEYNEDNYFASIMGGDTKETLDFFGLSLDKYEMSEDELNEQQNHPAGKTWGEGNAYTYNLDKVTFEDIMVHCDKLVSTVLALNTYQPNLMRTVSNPEDKNKLLNRAKRSSSTNKRKQMLRKADRVSMFSMLSPEISHLNSPKSPKTSGYRIHHRFTVIGHFRLQPHGKKLSKKKMIWIDSYEKGTGDELSNTPGGIKSQIIRMT